MKARKILLILILLILLGTSLRLYRLGYQSFWNDEIITIKSSNYSVKQLVNETRHNLLPLYYSVVRPFIGLENCEFWVRFPSVIFGVLSILLFYLIISNWLGKSTALIGASILTISPFHVWYSQDARPYAMLLFLALLSIWLLQLLLKDPKNSWLKLAFVISSAAIFYCHIVGIVFIGYLFAYVLLATPREKWKNWLLVFALIAFLILPGIYRMIIIQPMVPAGPNPFNPLSLSYTGWAFITGYSLGPSLSELHMPNRLDYVISSFHLILPVMLVFSVLFISGFIRLWKQFRQVFWYNSLFFLFPLVFATFGSMVTVHPYNVRYAILAFPPFLIFIAAGIKGIKVNWVRVGTFILIGLISLFSLLNLFFNEHYHKENTRAAAQFLEDHIQTGDPIICSVGYTCDNLQYYYKKDLNIIPYPKDSSFVNPKEVESDLNKIIGEKSRFWLFLSRIYHSDPEGHIQKFCEKHFKPILRLERSGVNLILYQRD